MTSERNGPTELSTCPTRIDGAPVLFAHRVTRAQCQDRQRGRYHKCFTCVHNNAYAAAHPRASLPQPAGASREDALVAAGLSARAG